jgi:riboflavin synthase
MFTGIVEQAGRVEAVRNAELLVRAKKVSRGLMPGSSVAVNGACLTVVAARAGVLKFDVLEETWRRTNLGMLAPGNLVNLERALRADARLDGHFVQGHVDGTGRVRRYERDGADYVLAVTAPATLMKYIVEKGSIAVDGISLTVAAVGRDWFRMCIIPQTRAVTNLAARRVGELMNLEVDVLAKYLEKLMKGRSN